LERYVGLSESAECAFPRRDFERDIWRRSGALFLILGLAIVLAPPLIQAPNASFKALPFFVLLAVWLALYFPLRKRQRQKLPSRKSTSCAPSRESIRSNGNAPSLLRKYFRRA
jgi:hypothetical protein